jgi:hypothetical protein
MPEATAQGFYLPVKNDVQGINQAIADNTAAFGSAGKLQGTIDLGNVTTLAVNPYGAKLDETLTTLNHELMHRFEAYVRFKNPDGTLNTSLLGKDSAHWSYLLDSKGSLMYGNGWKDNGNGTFTSTAAMNSFSPLDLYLMGMIPKEQVPPMLLIDNASIDKTQLPQLGATVSSTAKTISIDDIIAAEGARIPDAANSPKKFNVGFVLVTRPGDNSTAATAAIETLRSAWAGRFAELTRGVGGLADVTASLAVNINTPSDNATITGPDVTVSGSVINSSGAETGVVINGTPATVNGSRFIANHVPLQEGSNSVTITATDINGLTSTATRSIAAQAGHYIRISSNVDSGTGPLDISLRLNGSFIIANPTISIAGPVSVLLTPGASPTEFTVKLIVEGSYTITARGTGPYGQTYSDSVTVTVMSKQALETLLKAKWAGMKTALANQDITTAIKSFTSNNKQLYSNMFTALQTQLPQLVMNMQDIQPISISGGSATYRIRKNQNYRGQALVITHYIYFTKDENGLWKIERF